MTHVLKSTIAAIVVLGLFSSAALAGGYGGSTPPCSPIAPQEAQAFLGYTEHYRDGNFSVRHTDAAGAEVSVGAGGETAYGYGSSDTQINAPGGTKVWKRSVQRGRASTTNGSGSASGFTATFLKVRTADGRYYMYRGMASATASAGPGGTSTHRYGMAQSAGGRISR